MRISPVTATSRPTTPSPRFRAPVRTATKW
jgi:hypothetical protein